MTFTPEPIAIVGSGCRFPGGSTSPSALWKLLEKPRDVCQEIGPDRFDTTGFYHPDGSHHGTTNVRHAYLIQEDLKVFDAAFFNISPNEADSIDPQQRLLLETVYEALESGGHTLEALKGTDTAVYVGTMGVDYNDTLLRDLNTVPTYFATGTNRAIISNRVSYFFDWHGPSMTIDTACSSSLIAVHQGVQALRSGESRVAVACGTQVILGPEVFIFESKMKMLSPTGRSRMWDADADGYARGEGVAAIVLKRLSDAIADGDDIQCIIRGTGANQDGFSNGLTVPSTDAQAALIRQTYARAGLDPLNKVADRPQFFEAHGTGTKAGDPKEAAAIAQCFGKQVEGYDPLYVGSIKTVIGHTEGAAGLAGVIKGMGIIRHGFIPPNLLFNNLNPSIEPFYKGIEVPTAIKPWPKLPEGSVRRVSVNSFGFGGSNAHAILEEYKPAEQSCAIHVPNGTSFTPFVFSAASDVSLVAQLEAYSSYLKANVDVDATDFAFTLQSRRSRLPIKAAFSAATLEQLVTKLDDKLNTVKKSPGSTIGMRSKAGSSLLGVFTGQGAQWPAMGAELIRQSKFASDRIDELETFLGTLPEADRPAWSLREEILKGANTSRVAEAAISQPLCTAIQILLVDLLKAAGITFKAVVGHSSGEIGAAYAASFLSACDALRVAYYRGVFAKLAGNDSTGQKGAMMAVGTSTEDAEELLQLRAFRGRLAIAASNSSASLTLSGDADVVILAKKVFDEEKKFARLLKVDTAYHSHHMIPCGDAYIAALRACGVRVQKDRPTTTAWFSSVFPSSKPMEPTDEIQDVYWRDNMANTVLFADAVRNAVSSDPQLALAIEVGPHPALKGPATQNISDVQPNPLPYTGVLSRGKSDVTSFSDALGYIWTQLSSLDVDFQSFQQLVTGSISKPKLLSGLPSYQWNHGRVHWTESRKSRKTRGRDRPFHELLGVLSPDSTSRDLRWNNVLKPSEIRWLDGHQLQGQTVFPAAGYCAMALEAAKWLAGNKPVEAFELHDLAIPRAIAFEDDNQGVETIVTLTAIDTQNGTTTADFTLYSCPITGTEQEMDPVATGSVKIIHGTPSFEALASAPLDASTMTAVDTDRFYSGLSKLGYGYYESFRTMTELKRSLNKSSVLISTFPYNDEDATVYMVHPTWLDVAFQASMLAYSAPGDERLWSLHVPTSIRTIRVNPEVCGALPMSESQVPVCSTLSDSEEFRASIDIFSGDVGDYCMVQVEDLQIKPFAPATDANDRRLFSYTKLDLAAPDGVPIVKGINPTSDEVNMAVICERVSYWYVRKWKAEITDADWEKGQAHHVHLRNYINHTISTVSRGQHPTVKKSWNSDTEEDIKALLELHADNIDLKLLSAVGENIPAAVRGDTTILEHMLPNNMLDDFYKEGLGFARYNSFLQGMVKQMIHRYPHARILEIGAGTGGATKAVLQGIGRAFSTYTYTDISVGFFEKAAEVFKAFSDKMVFKTLDAERLPSTQGYEAHSYDIIIASNVLHATESMEKTLRHTRELLKPGGYLVLLEITNNGPIRFTNIMGGLSGWWAGVDDGRRWAPTMTPTEWNSHLKKVGFAGVDAITPEVDPLAWPFSIIASQAIDDRLNFLRKPLFKSKSAVSISIDSLVILGGRSLESSNIAEELSSILDRYCSEITVLDDLPTEDEALDIAPMSTFINLADLDSPIFKDMTTERLEALQRLYDMAKHVLWITVGAQAQNPYHMASITFNRAVSHEAGHVNLNHLDFSDLDDNTPKTIAEHLLRQFALEEFGTSSSKPIMWSKEPEMFWDKGKLKVPRIMDNAAQNDRLNSTRRHISRSLPICSSKLSITVSDESNASLVEEVLPTTSEEGSLVRVMSSSLKALHAAADTYLYLSLGKYEESVEKPVVSLSTSNSCVVTPVASVAVDAAQATNGLLVYVASELLAASLVDNLPSGSSLVVLASGKDSFLAAALSRQAIAKGVRITFTCDASASAELQSVKAITLNARAPRHVTGRILKPTKATHYLDLTLATSGIASELSENIAHVLPLGYKRIELSDLTRNESVLSVSKDILIARISTAVSDAVRLAPSSAAEDMVIPLDKVSEASQSASTISVVRWPQEGNVEVTVRSLDATRLFKSDRTYLMVGLTGEIGRSLTEWMVANGAGCVVLTSRNPKISDKWLESFKDTATVKVYPMDVTDMNNVENVVNDVKATCPPIAGVANGAMVLNDSLFSKMSLSAMNSVLGPKIAGTNNLDQLFYDDDLDFFVLFSSSACVVGNSGQSNYAAANGYLNSLVRQRRMRGLAASAFDIGRVAGIGYVETANATVTAQLTRFGLIAINEAEFRQTFAETIRSGYPLPGDKDTIPDAVITTGIYSVRDDEHIPGPWLENPRFAHCIVEGKSAKSQEDGASKKSTLPVTEQLAQAGSMEQALDIIKESFFTKLRVILQLGDQAIDPDTALVELGVDSLVAVEVRSWFLKELKVEIPVLKVVGGASAAALCQQALEKLPEEMLSGIGSGEGDKAIITPPKAESAKPTIQPTVPEPTSASTSDSRSESSTSEQNDTLTVSHASSTQPSSYTPSLTGESETKSTPAPKPTVLKQAVAGKPARRFLKTKPISFGQSRFWFLRLLLDDPTTFNVSFYYKVTGSLRVGDLERAVRLVTARHEALRTCIVEDGSQLDKAYQKVMPSSPMRLEHKKVSTLGEVIEEYHRLKEHVFDLAGGEMFRLVLVTLDPTTHYLLFNYHHILMDGGSFQVYLTDLEKAYNGLSLGPSPAQFPDFSTKQRDAYENGEMNEQLAYWRSVFPTGEQPPVLPLLPIARTGSRIAMNEWDVHQVSVHLGSDLAGRVKSVAMAARSTPFHLYLAAFKTILFLFTEAQDLAIGIADANRNFGNVENSIGFFLNLLTLRFKRQPMQSFSDAVTEARTITYDALNNSRVPFDVLLQELKVARSSLHSPFFQAFFDYRQGAQEKHPFGNTQFEFQELHPGRTAYDITIDVTDNATDALVMFRAQKGLYDLSAANLLIETYVQLLDTLLKTPSTSLQDTRLFGGDQLSQAVQIGSGPELTSDWPATLPHRIDQIAQENADKIAVKDGLGTVLTYSDLSNRIQAIAEALRKAGVVAGSRVPVFETASADWPASMLAIMRLGAVYVPLDNRNPVPRLAGMVQDCEPTAILVDDTTAADAPKLNVPTATIVNVANIPTQPSTSIANVANADSPAAILYTSGSTGNPKGIMVTHSGLCNEIEGYTKTWNLGAERTLQQSAFTFNHSSDQMYTGLTNGGMVYIVPWSKRGDPIEITKIVRDEGITYTKATPSEYSLWMQYGSDNLKDASAWRFAFGGGEPLTTVVTQEFAALNLPQLSFFNSYGPTEISISSHKMGIDYRALPTNDRIPCGFSLPNYTTYILDENLNPVMTGMPGEVCIGGAGVSLGYLNNKELTGKHFVENPHASPFYKANGWTRLYRTGDIGHMLEDGAMVFRSRTDGDTQAKIRGLRIELSDIESNIVIASDGALREAVVSLRENDVLIAHVVFAPNHNVTDQDGFLDRLLAKLPLPQYMIPVVAVPLDKLPLTNHSKVDRKVLRSMPLPQRSPTHASEELTDTMVQLKRVWKEVLSDTGVGLEITPSSNFFLIGGNSLLAIRLQARIRETFGTIIRLVDLLGANTLEDMARKIEEVSSVEVINWDEETLPPSVPSFLQNLPVSSSEPKKGKTVLVTGATGFLSKHLLPQLAANPDVSSIHAIAVRDTGKLLAHDKIVAHEGDLSDSLLGLSENVFRDLAGKADIILHAGAIRSFWDNYHTLRPINVLPTKELIKLAAPRQVPIHYISTVGVLPWVTKEAISAANQTPPADGSNGYVASRWASERLLERSSAAIGIPISIYRFLPSASTSATKQLLDSLVSFVDKTGLTPELSTWDGRMDLIPADEVAQWMHKSILEQPIAGFTKFFHYQSSIAVTVGEMKAHIEKERGERGLEQLPVLKWIGRIKSLGWEYFLASQQATITGRGGIKFESRR